METKDEYLKLENVRLRTKLRDFENNQNEQKKTYIQYTTTLKKQIHENKKEIEFLKQENELLKNNINKLPKILRKIFIRNERCEIKYIGSGK